MRLTILAENASRRRGENAKGGIHAAKAAGSIDIDSAFARKSAQGVGKKIRARLQPKEKRS